MSLSRAFTTRRLKTSNAPADIPKLPQRAHSLRHKISAPLQLIHTTNMLSYNAPDLPLSRPSRIDTAVTPRTSEDDSDSMATNESTPPTSPDVASRDYFKKPAIMKSFFAPEPEAAPAIPQRAPSHTKKNSCDAIARSRSVRMSMDSELSLSRPGPTFSRSASTSTRASSISTARSLKQLVPPAPAPPSPPASISASEAHPFGPELAQVTELAEEYSTSSQLALVDEDAEYLQSRGLLKFNANDYLGAIQGLTYFFFPETSHPSAATPLWI